MPPLRTDENASRLEFRHINDQEWIRLLLEPDDEKSLQEWDEEVLDEAELSDEQRDEPR